MAPSRKPATSAEVALVPLKNCLANLPSSLVSLLFNANTTTQNVIVELQYRSSVSWPGSQSNGGSVQRSSYFGWTGLPSKRRLASVYGRDSFSRGLSTSAAREQDIAVVEIDMIFGRTLGLAEGHKVGLFLHLDPPVVHTVNIEPLTAIDWELIELHATFLELNLLQQIRALPNPAYSDASSGQAEHLHPLTLHLSPTSTVNIVISGLVPPVSSTSAFAKIVPDAEVIVAPKVRQKSTRPSQVESKSTTSTGRKSTGGRSTGSTVRPKSGRSDLITRGAAYLRGVDRQFAEGWFDEDLDDQVNDDLVVWIDRERLVMDELRGIDWVCVSVIWPAGLQSSVDLQQGQQKDLELGEAGKPTPKLVSRVSPWDDAPSSQHVALSSPLCIALGCPGIVGGIIRIEAAPSQVQQSTVKSLKLYPFTVDASRKKDGLRFGGDTSASRDALAESIKVAYGSPGSKTGLMSGPLTDGMILPRIQNRILTATFGGGILRFDPPLKNSDAAKPAYGWLLGSESKLSIDMQSEIPRPSDSSQLPMPAETQIPASAPEMVGTDSIISQSLASLTRSSSILLTGGLGSGKTTLSQLLGHRLRQSHLFHVTYFSCRKLIAGDTRVSTIKETFNQLFRSASWCARLGGRSVVILDDLEKLCPVETELQVGGENSRSRQVSELLCSVVREHCNTVPYIALLATVQSKDSLNNIVVGGHVFREILTLKAPDKEGRRRVLEQLTREDKCLRTPKGHTQPLSTSTQDSWLSPSSSGSHSSSSDTAGFVLSPDLDLLDLAGKTDGHMPGDLVLLVARARNEALIRSVQDAMADSSTITFKKEDFERALEGFTPASLRNVTLTSSSTSFSSIGGLHSTRKTLLETLQYPTKYAPIFAQCPLRLRSGLLLYGFPGCGKTLLASAVAGECGLNFISVKGPEILNKYIGASEKSVRDLFERAEAARPCVLFFDEFDSIAPKRGHDSTGVTDRVVNQLLTQMDGAEGLSGVYVLAATSRPDLIDPALLRPGRLDKSLLCDMPSHSDRIEIIHTVCKKLTLSDGVRSRVIEIASRTEGYSGADLQAVVYNAHLEAIHDLLGRQPPTSVGKISSGNALKSVAKGGVEMTNSSFIQFLYSPSEKESIASSRNLLSPPAVIAAKLDSLKQARRRQFQLEHGTSGSRASTDGAAESESCEDVLIQWDHIERSLSTTRRSLSDAERKRLEAIYREFVVGRNGEMPNGEGAREIGGRTSLV